MWAVSGGQGGDQLPLVCAALVRDTPALAAQSDITLAIMDMIG